MLSCSIETSVGGVTGELKSSLREFSGPFIPSAFGSSAKGIFYGNLSAVVAQEVAFLQ